MFEGRARRNRLFGVRGSSIHARAASRLQNVPGVERAALANSHVLTGGSSRATLTIQSDRRIVTERPVPRMRVVPGFFATLGIPVIAGRDFTEEDTRDHEKTGFRTIIVNESFARRYFGGRSPIGERVGVGSRPDTKTTIEIVGMVRDFSFRFLREDSEPEHVFPVRADGAAGGKWCVLSEGARRPRDSARAIRAAVAEWTRGSTSR